jgi:hypothetical protein
MIQQILNIIIPKRKPAPPRPPMPERNQGFILNVRTSAGNIILTEFGYSINGNLYVEVVREPGVKTFPNRVVVKNLGKYGFRVKAEPLMIYSITLELNKIAKAYLEHREPTNVSNVNSVWKWEILPQGTYELPGNRAIAWEWTT